MNSFGQIRLKRVYGTNFTMHCEIIICSFKTGKTMVFVHFQTSILVLSVIDLTVFTGSAHRSRCHMTYNFPHYTEVKWGYSVRKG